MSSKNQSSKLLNIMLSALMLLGVNATECKAVNYGKNGVSYVLLNTDFAPPSGAGVYRFNNRAGDPITPIKAFKDLKGAQGLAADQSYNTKVYLLYPNVEGKYYDAAVGFLPRDMNFPEDSDMYVKLATPGEMSATQEIKYNKSYGADIYAWKTETYYEDEDYYDSKAKKWKTRKVKKTRQVHDSSKPWYVTGAYAKARAAHGYQYWSSHYYVNFAGPAGIKGGTTMWNGSSSDVIVHPKDSRKVILPSGYAGISYYLYGSSKAPKGNSGKPADGQAGRPTYTWAHANKMGNYMHNGKAKDTDDDDGHHCHSDWYYGAVIKRVYKLRDKTLKMYYGADDYVTKNQTLKVDGDAGDVLRTQDFKVMEYYGKWCGDNCIPGGAAPDKELEAFLATINVLSTTTGNRYGFNHKGNPGGGGVNAALRVVKKNSSGRYVTQDVNIAGLSNITNKARFSSPSQIKTIGVSSNWNGNDYIYGSKADSFVVQDSWWGLGGIGYEYDETTKKVKKFDFMTNKNDAGEVIGSINGTVDAVGVDGNAYLYALKTEVKPSNGDMVNAGNYLGSNPSSGNHSIAGRSLSVTVSSWLRPSDSGSTKVSSPKDGDYKEVTIKQEVYKTIYRYAESTNTSTDKAKLGAEEYRGTIKAGLDTWTGRLVKTSSSYYYTNFELEKGTSVSKHKAELAVVNVADHPTSIDGTPDGQRYLCGVGTDKSVRDGKIIAEQDKVTFKVEGYKPNNSSFKKVGSFVGINNIRINNIQNDNGEHKFDENGDGHYSGYESSMFEADGKITEVYWYVYKVENTSVAQFKSDPKVIKTLVNGSQVSKSTVSPGDCRWTYQFPDPGRYMVKAQIKYNYFTNYDTAEKPKDLKASTRSKYTEPMLINVYARDLRPNTTPSYISNIRITKTNNKTKPSHGGIPAASKSSSDFDTCEGTENQNKFGDLKIEFDAQFARSENDTNSTSDLHTYDGIGAWDYNYYKELYRQAKNLGISGITIPAISTGHVYNWVNNAVDSEYALLNSYSKTIYNPGFQKETEKGRSYKNGTQRSGDPTDDDRKFIQWILYLRKVTPQEEATKPAGTIISTRGDVIASGNLLASAINTRATLTGGSNRKYHVSFEIKDIDSKINVPRDCKNYVLDFELVYPRMTWLNNQLGYTGDRDSSHNYFSSLVPYREGNANRPVHVISKIYQGTSGGILDWNNTMSGSSLFLTEPNITLNVRDTVLPEYLDGNVSSDNGTDSMGRALSGDPRGSLAKGKTTSLPYIESTGDVIASGRFDYSVKDNNPFMQFQRPTSETSASIVKAIRGMNASDADKGIKLYLERVGAKGTKFSPNKLDSFDNSLNNKHLEESRSIGSNRTVTMDKLDTNDLWYTKNDWEIKFNYVEKIAKLSGFETPTKRGSSGMPTYDINHLRENIEATNWVGSLSYAVTGKIYDGIGTDTTGLDHFLYDSDIDTKKTGYYSGIAGYGTTKPRGSIVANRQNFLERYDNDPPSIGVQIISQNDMRKWDIQLLEGVNDARSFAKTVADLAPSRLIMDYYELKGAKETKLSSLPSASQKINGSTNFYDPKGYTSPKYNDAVPTGCNYKVSTKDKATIKFRKSARILINVDIFDNCGFLKLSKAYITVKGDSLDFFKDVSLEPSHEINNGGIAKEKYRSSKKQPRGSFSVDIPSTANSIVVNVFAQDAFGNKREIEIPVTLVESTFDARVIETQEHKD